MARSRLLEINFPKTPLSERRPGFSLEKNGFTRVNRRAALWLHSAPSFASEDAAHSWQHLGRQVLAVRTLATAAFATAGADAPPLVAPAEFAAAAPRRHPYQECQLYSHWMEVHRSPRREGSIRLPALDGLLCDGWPRRTVGGAVCTAFEHDARRDARSTRESARKVAAGMCSMEGLAGFPPQLRQDGER